MSDLLILANYFTKSCIHFKMHNYIVYVIMYVTDKIDVIYQTTMQITMH